MAHTLNTVDRARISARMEVWQLPVMMQRWWRLKRRRHATLDMKTIKRLHADLLRMGSVTHQKGDGPPKRVVTDEAKANAAAIPSRSPS